MFKCTHSPRFCTWKSRLSLTLFFFIEFSGHFIQRHRTTASLHKSSLLSGIEQKMCVNWGRWSTTVANSFSLKLHKVYVYVDLLVEKILIAHCDLCQWPPFSLHVHAIHTTCVYTRLVCVCSACSCYILMEPASFCTPYFPRMCVWQLISMCTWILVTNGTLNKGYGTLFGIV